MTEPDADRAVRVQRMTAAGLTAREIAEALGISSRTVLRHRVATGCARPAAKHLTPEQIAQAQALLDGGCSVLEVARTIGCGHYPIARHFPGRGLAAATLRRLHPRKETFRRAGYTAELNPSRPTKR